MEAYIAKNKEDFLPKNIRQVGDSDPDIRVYIEDYAYSFIRELQMDEDEDGRVGILFGAEYAGNANDPKSPEKYVFVKGAMEVINASVFEGKIAFTEETWAGLNNMRNRFFSGMEIVGWFVTSSSISVANNASIERTHIDSFGRDKLLFFLDNTQQEEDLYTCFNEGLEPLDGYVIYFEKNQQMQEYMASVSELRSHTKADDSANRRYRQILKEDKTEEKAKSQLSLMYGLSAVLVILVLVIGVGRLNVKRDIEKNSVAETTSLVSVIEDVQAEGNAGAVQDETLNVDYANGNVTPTTEEDSLSGEETSEALTEEMTTEEVTEEITTEEPTTEEPTTEAPTHKVYVVKEGDTLSGILMAEYGRMDNQLLQELLDLNNITDGGNSINIGDELLLP